MSVVAIWAVFGLACAAIIAAGVRAKYREKGEERSRPWRAA
jgi:hypothetical protein